MERVSSRLAAPPGALGAIVHPTPERERRVRGRPQREQRERGRSGRESGADERRFEDALAGRAGAGAAEMSAAARGRAGELDVGAAPDEEPGAHLDLTA